MASFKAKFPVLQELFAKNHRGGPLGPPAGRGLTFAFITALYQTPGLSCCAIVAMGNASRRAPRNIATGYCQMLSVVSLKKIIFTA